MSNEFERTKQQLKDIKDRLDICGAVYPRMGTYIPGVNAPLIDQDNHVELFKIQSLFLEYLKENNLPYLATINNWNEGQIRELIELENQLCERFIGDRSRYVMYIANGDYDFEDEAEASDNLSSILRYIIKTRSADTIKELKEPSNWSLDLDLHKRQLNDILVKVVELNYNDNDEDRYWDLESERLLSLILEPSIDGRNFWNPFLKNENANTFEKEHELHKRYALGLDKIKNMLGRELETLKIMRNEGLIFPDDKYEEAIKIVKEKYNDITESFTKEYYHLGGHSLKALLLQKIDPEAQYLTKPEIDTRVYHLLEDIFTLTRRGPIIDPSDEDIISGQADIECSGKGPEGHAR